MPCALMDTLMVEHADHYGQFVFFAQKSSNRTTRVQIKQTVSPNHAAPGLTVVAQMSIEVC